jgi:hypothetical protein
MMFDTFRDKYNFIRKRRARMRRLASNISICTECGKLFKPRNGGSTLFLCAVCAIGATMPPVERFYFLSAAHNGVNLAQAAQDARYRYAREELMWRAP